MKIIYSGKRAAPPRADMFLPKWILVSAILLCIISVLNLVLVLLMEDWDLFYNVMTDIPIGIILFLCCIILNNPTPKSHRFKGFQ